jgi:opacity protein-like surface antigen
MIAASGLMALAFATQASAADFPQTIPMPDMSGGGGGSSWSSASFGGGWYLRGDVGARWYKHSGTDTAGVTGFPTNSKLKSGLDAGVGFGYKAGFLRADVTADYALPVDYTATAVTTNDTRARLQMSTVMGNLYFDLGTWGGLTPYVGAGAGAGFARTTQFVRPAYVGPDTTLQTRFAYAAMGGLAMKVAPNLQLDLGYRYLNYGDIKLASEAAGDTYARKVAAHEVRLGLRWSFDDLPNR